ncbi:MAG TPA: thioesterase family protein [Polyangiales bacterium]|nr:thioesterase family protein [Polyangiales bacterium]
MGKPVVYEPGQIATTFRHTVAFYETDAMGIVHHSNYVRYLELARVQYMAEHDRPYLEYVARGFHMPVTRVSVSYKKACRFADAIDITCWLTWARHASFGFAYRLAVGGQLACTGESDHAIIDRESRPVRLPPDMRERMHRHLGIDEEDA